ncbi:MAG TPA: ATP-dependent sacrificial sulfur transferase LarE [Acidobacteria bacterium]|nr:ATP-dependent sacrificial sulfur transferase LarE [Acidobacteriota bacterium]
MFRKYRRLVRILKPQGSLLVAFSGGVDSSLLLRAAVEALGNKVLAAVVDSPIVHREEIRTARSIARQLGVPLRTVRSDDYLAEEFKKNSPLRCYVCKRALFRRLLDLARKEGLAGVVEGSNLDDELDYRPGKKALQELGVRSPLKEAGLRKAEIRLLARHFRLPNWDRPANACLATRIPFGQPVEPEWLEKIDRGESFLKKLGFSQVRLRHHGETARIEVRPEEISLAVKPENRPKIIDRLKKLGWTYVTFDLEGYRTGSLNPSARKRKT